MTIDARPKTQRVPPGQVETRKWPILHYGLVPKIDPAQFQLRIFGEVEQPYTLTWDELISLPRVEVLCDIHCVTQWSRLDTVFSGISVPVILERAKVKPTAKFALIHAAPDYTTNVPIGDLNRPECLIATHFGNEPLTPEHGGPARLVISHLYFWKSAKWITGIELLREDVPGFWERNGYHDRGDPWKEERYGSATHARMRRGAIW